jgi:hypothetical protein
LPLNNVFTELKIATMQMNEQNAGVALEKGKTSAAKILFSMVTEFHNTLIIDSDDIW